MKMYQESGDKIEIIMHALADKDNFNAQNLNAREIAFRLNPDLFNVTLFYKTSPDKRLLDKKNIKLIKISNNSYISSYNILKYLWGKEHDIFFYVRPFYTDYLYFKFRKIFKDKKITIHQVENALPSPSTKMHRKIAKANALCSDYVFSVSKYVSETVKKEYGIDTPIMYVGVDTNVFVPPTEKNNKGVKVLYVGSFQERKRPYLVLEAAKHFPDVEFILIGRGPLRGKLILMKEKQNLSNVEIRENIPFSELISCYQNSDIFLFPSIHEGFPKVTIEAASCGLPVILFHNYKPETVLDNKTGFIVKDFHEMLEKLEILINDAELRWKMGNNAREYVKNFDWDVIVKKWEEIFVNTL